jgi:hypothetical protein
MLKFGLKMPFHTSNVAGVLAFAALAFSLYHFARKPLESEPPKENLPGTPDARIEQ